MRELGLRQLAHHAARRRRRARRARGPLRRRRARLERRLEFLTSVCQLVAGVFDSTALLDEAEDRTACARSSIELGARPRRAPRRRGTSPSAPRRACAAPSRCSRLRHLVARRGLPALPRQRGRATASDESVRGRILAARPLPVHHEQALEDREILVISSLGRRAPHRLRARGLRRVRLPQRRLDPTREQRPGRRPDRRLRRARARLQRRALVPRRRPARTVADALRNADLLAGLRRGNSGAPRAGGARRPPQRGRHAARSSPGRSPSGCAPSSPPRTATSGRSTAACSAASPAWTAAAGTRTRSGRSASSPPTRPPSTPWPPTSRWSSATSRAPTSARRRWQAYRRWGFRSMVSLPLVVDGRAIGLIDVFDTKVRDYTVHLDLIRNVGRLLAGSFEKAMLVERLEGGNRDLRLLVDSGLEFGATLDVDAVLRTVARAHPGGLGGRPLRRATGWTATRSRSSSPSAGTGTRTPSASGTRCDDYGTLPRGRSRRAGRSLRSTSSRRPRHDRARARGRASSGGTARASTSR